MTDDRHDVFTDDEIDPVIEQLREEFLADARERALKKWIADRYRAANPTLIRPNYWESDDDV